MLSGESVVPIYKHEDKDILCIECECNWNRPKCLYFTISSPKQISLKKMLLLSTIIYARDKNIFRSSFLGTMQAVILKEVFFKALILHEIDAPILFSRIRDVPIFIGQKYNL